MNLRHGKLSKAEDEIQMMQDLVKEYGTFPDDIYQYSEESFPLKKGAANEAGAVVVSNLKDMYVSC